MATRDAVHGLTRSVEEAESLAVFEAIQWSNLRSLSSICIRSDSSNVISYLNKTSNQISGFASSILGDCLVLINNACFTKFEYVQRGLNSYADKATKQSRRMSVTGSWEVDYPHFLSQNL